MSKKVTHILIPWLITVVALYFAFRGVDFSSLLNHVKQAELTPILLAVTLTLASYLTRAYRWQFLFLHPTMRYLDSVKVLILGFFMNNVLPARAGELVRAHMGSKISGDSRTLVLATIASERLIDGVTISLMFLIFAGGLGDKEISTELMYVAYAFGIATLMVLALLLLRERVFSLVERLHARWDTRASAFALERVRIFINGLKPLFMGSRLVPVLLLSAIIWSIELSVYYFIGLAFNASLSIPLCVLFMVAVNFSSLIPAAPGGIGVIEAVGSAALVSVGIGREMALSMVLCQHAIQYLVVGIPGVMVILTWRRGVKSFSELTGDATEENDLTQSTVNQ